MCPRRSQGGSGTAGKLRCCAAAGLSWGNEVQGPIRSIFLGNGGSSPNGEVLERLWDPRLEVWACRGSGADPGAQEQAPCWEYFLWDNASPALNSSLLISFSPWMSWRMDVSHPVWMLQTHRLCLLLHPQSSSSSSYHCCGTEAHSLTPELGCALVVGQRCPRVSFPCDRTPIQPLGAAREC